MIPRDRILHGLWSLFVRPDRFEKITVALRPRGHCSRFTSAWSVTSTARCSPPRNEGSLDLRDRQKSSSERSWSSSGLPLASAGRGLRSSSRGTSGVELDKDVVRRVLAKRYRPDPGGGKPSWLTSVGHAKDSLWSVDVFRCESIMLRTYWVLVVMDQFTRRIVGVGIHAGRVDGTALRRTFNLAIARQGTLRYLSSDKDPLFESHRWQANLRILEVEVIKCVPYVPIFHPFVERLIGTIRRGFLDLTLFWNSVDLERKLSVFRDYYNFGRVHSGVHGTTPEEIGGELTGKLADRGTFRRRTHCRGLYQLPAAA